MKKFWKNLCAGSMLVACGIGITACKEKNTLVSSDIDGDGVISSWEQVFDRKEKSTFDGVIPVGDIKNINSVDDFLAINNNVEVDGQRQKYIYVLQKDLDLGGRTVAIDLGDSEFYGNNHIIYNFKLGKISNSTEDGVSVVSNVNVYSLFYSYKNVLPETESSAYIAKVKNLRLYMGLQRFETASEESTQDCYYSPFYNIAGLDTIQVKGFIDVSMPKKNSASTYNIFASMLSNSNFELNEQNGVIIENCTVEGRISVKGLKDCRASAIVGGIETNINDSSRIYNCKVLANIDVISPISISIGGVVAENYGFVSTCEFDGTINSSVLYETSSSVVGAIVGTNGPLAEVKNCKNSKTTILNLSVSADEIVSDPGNLQSKENSLGGIVGKNYGGIVELCTSDAVLNISNLNTIYAGGICGYSEKGIISYIISRGSINITNVKNVYTAQISGRSEYGLFEKIVTNTALTVDNQQIDSKTCVGMVTIFETRNDMSDFSLTPYFKNIIVGGSTTITVKKSTGTSYFYNLGLRNSYKIVESIEGSEDTTTTTVVPWIYNTLHYINGDNKLTVFTIDSNGNKESISLNVEYAEEGSKKYVTSINLTARNIIEEADFKSFLNHKEVNIYENILLNDLQFTINEDTASRSYFGYKRSNGNFALFDNEVTESYSHEPGSVGWCENDSKDEMLSFIYYLINFNSGNGTDYYAIKVGKNYLNLSDEVDDQTYEDGMNVKTKNFKDAVNNCFGCLNTIPQVKYYDKNCVEITDANSNVGELVYFVQFICSYGNSNFSLTFDVANLQEGMISSDESDLKNYDDYYLLYLNFTISSITTH